MLQLLTSKPVLYVCNVDEDEAADRQRPFRSAWRRWPRTQGAAAVVISAKIEEEIASSTPTKRDDVPRGAGAARGRASTG